MKQFILTLSLFVSMTLLAQPFGPGGPGNGGGPPNPPAGYCAQNPGDPACDNGAAVPVSSTEGMVIFIFLSGIFFYYKINGNSFKIKKL